MDEILNCSSSDDDTEIQDLNLLNQVLESDDIIANDNISQSQYSESIASTSASQVSVASLNKIETALAFNKLMDEKLKKLEAILTKRLKECHYELDVLNERAGALSNDHKRLFRFMNCGKPFFKHPIHGVPLPNNDTKAIAEANMFDIAGKGSIHGWSIKDKREFTAVVLKLSKDIYSKQLNSEIAQLNRKEQTNEIKLRIQELEKKLEMVPKLLLIDIAVSIDEDYDWELISYVLGSKHSPLEYKAIWKLFLHPSINKAPWKEREHKKLMDLAVKYNYHDWDQIAKDLNTKRTGYQCFVYHRTNVGNFNVGVKWSKEEEEFLKRLVEHYKEGNFIPWTQIASKMVLRTKTQIYGKYKSMNGNKGRFSKEEDSVILTCVKKFGTDFKKIAQFVTGRSTIQLRNRYRVLSLSRVSAVWTVEEDKRLMKLLGNQEDINFADVVKFFPGKSRSNLRTRFMYVQAWARNHPDKDLALCPRRGARRLGHGCEGNNLMSALEKLKDCMETKLLDNKPRKKAESRYEAEVDDLIVTTLINEEFGEPLNPISDSETRRQKEKEEKNIESLLILLQAKLDKEEFEKKHHEKYPLLLSGRASSPIKFNSYSKNKIKEKVFKSQIWGAHGDNELETRLNVMAPNISTLLGCKSLLGSFKATEPLQSVGYLCSKNKIFREQFERLLKRFEFLFMWPMVLSGSFPTNDDQNDDSNDELDDANITLPKNIQAKMKAYEKLCGKKN